MSFILKALIITLIGFILGIILTFEIRKVFARAQYRLGPLTSVYPELKALLGSTRILQPLYDVLKLFYKETIIPQTTSKILFIISPVISLLLSVFSLYFVSFGGFSVFANRDHSLIWLIYVLIAITIFWLIGSASSSSPWAIIGTRREAELLFSIEFSLLISAFSIAIISNSLSIQEIVYAQREFLPFILVNPMAAITFILSILGKLRLKPFDISEAEVEIVSGPCTEYSGKLLGLIYLSKYFMTVTLVAFFIDLFLAGGQISNFTLLNVITFIILTLIVTFILSLIHALMPRFKIDQAFKWVLTRMWPLSIISLIFSLIIRSLGVV